MEREALATFRRVLFRERLQVGFEIISGIRFQLFDCFSFNPFNVSVRRAPIAFSCLGRETVIAAGLDKRFLNHDVVLTDDSRHVNKLLIQDFYGLESGKCLSFTARRVIRLNALIL